MISDDELILYYYRDGLDAADRARIGAALSEHPDIAQRMHGLVARLDAAAAMPEVPVPDDVQQRWRAALERASLKEEKRAERAPRRSFLMDLRWPAAAAVAILAFVFVMKTAKPPAPDQTAGVATPAISAEPGAGDASAYERGLKFHLASTEQQLAEIGSANPEERARLVDALIAQNRMYALAAERVGEPQLARVLRAFAPVLESLAHGGGDSSASIAQLSFELRVMQGRLGAGAPSNNPSTTL
jgi:hypothetical protein